MKDSQLMAAGVLVAALLGTVVLHQVAIAEGAAVGLDQLEVAILGLAVTAVATKRAFA
jgi:hypothetical protein